MNKEITKHYIETLSAEYTTEPITDTQYHIELRNNVCIIDFQCTRSFEDWLHNIRIPKRWHDGELVHSGYLKKWQVIQKEILGVIKYEFDFVLVRGYSQGGALATLAYKAFYDLAIPVKGIVFGSPQVFSIFTDNEIFSDLVRYETPRDIVPRLPSFLLLYRGVGNRKLLKKVLWYKRLIPSIKSHLPAKYLELLPGIE